MQIRFESQAAQAAPLAPWARERARFALRRFGGLLARVRLQLADLNGPRGGLDKRCRVELRAAGGDRVVLSVVAHDWHAAVDRALQRAVQALLRQRQRRRRTPLRQHPDRWLASLGAA